MPTPIPAVELRDAAKTYGTLVALRQLTLSIGAGESVVILGDNGAGKSTLLRLIAGLAAPTRGSVRVLGQEPALVRGRIAYMSHAAMLYDELTAIENLRYFQQLHRTGAADCACATGSPELALRAVGLDPFLARPVAHYSQGMRQRVSLARALQTDPELLLLDEPFSNLDVSGAQQMVELLADFLTWPLASHQPRTLLLTTHQAQLAAPLARNTITLSQGTLARQTHSGNQMHAGSQTPA